jgi:hypothetical protein
MRRPYASRTNPIVYLIPIIGALVLTFGILMNVFNERATRWGKKIQRRLSMWPNSERLITPYFVRFLGIYLIVWRTAFFVGGHTAILQD